MSSVCSGGGVVVVSVYLRGGEGGCDCERERERGVRVYMCVCWGGICTRASVHVGVRV